MRPISVPRADRRDARARTRGYDRLVGLPERVIGSLLGLALGDALGAPFEGSRAARVPDPVPALELPWMGLPPGSTTDDTAMARNLSRSLAARGGFDPEDLIARHLAWFRTSPPGIGRLTRGVLARIAGGTPWQDAARLVWEERGPEVAAGNGSVMCCAPLGLAHAGRPDDLPDLAARLSALTHWDERCRTACLAVTLAVAALARGEPAERAVPEALVSVEDLPGGEELGFLGGAVGDVRAVDGPDMGFCLYAAAVGLRAAAEAPGAEAGLRWAVGLGGDTDTNGAVAGALLGARDGAAALPPSWLDRLVDREAIEAEARALVPLALHR